MSDHPIKGLIETSLEKIKDMIDVDTIIGEAVTTPDGTIIIPVSRVGFGFTAIGSDLPTKNKDVMTPEFFGGGSGAGVSIKPVAFLVVGQGQIKLLPIDGTTNTVVDKIFDYVPGLIDKVNEMIKGDKKEEEN